MAVVISCEVFGQRNGNKVEAVAPDFWPVATGKTFSASKEKKNRSMPSEGRLGQTPTGREVIGRSSRGCSCFRSVNPHPVLAFLSWVYDLVAEPPARYSAPRPVISVPDRFIDGHEHHLCAPTRKTLAWWQSSANMECERAPSLGGLLLQYPFVGAPGPDRLIGIK